MFLPSCNILCASPFSAWNCNVAGNPSIPYYLVAFLKAELILVFKKENNIGSSWRKRQNSIKRSLKIIKFERKFS
jgi:hypothetical protein